VWNACINHKIKQCKTITTQMAFCYPTTYQFQFVIVHRVWHWQLTRHALNMKKMWDWWFDCLYRLSKLIEIQMINRISKKITLPVPPDLLGRLLALLGWLMTTYVSFEVTVPSTLIVTNWAGERSFTGVYYAGERPVEWPFSCSVCDYQCRRDCDLKRHIRRHKSPQ